jgi:hypothetical protein
MENFHAKLFVFGMCVYVHFVHDYYNSFDSQNVWGYVDGKVLIGLLSGSL